jgi:indole-3-glycerol phosphate synthase
MPSLEQLISSSRRAVEQRRGARPLEQLAREVEGMAPIRPFTEWIGGDEISFVLRLPGDDPQLLELAEQGEAAGLAVPFDQLAATPGRTMLPLMQTDMIVDVYQLYESRAGGADGVVLMAAAFEDADRSLVDLHDLAVDLGLDVIVEVAEEEEIEHTLELLDPDSFLIRNRGGHGTGDADFERTFSLLEEVPAGKVVLSQGGVRRREEVVALQSAGVDAAIIGPWVVEAGLLGTLEVLRGDAR